MQRRPGIAHKENNKLVQTANAVPFNSTTTAVKGALGKGLDVIRFRGPTTFQFSKRVGIANLRAAAERNRAVREQTKFENRLLTTDYFSSSAGFSSGAAISSTAPWTSKLTAVPP